MLAYHVGIGGETAGLLIARPLVLLIVRIQTAFHDQTTLRRANPIQLIAGVFLVFVVMSISAAFVARMAEG